MGVTEGHRPPGPSRAGVLSGDPWCNMPVMARGLPLRGETIGTESFPESEKSPFGRGWMIGRRRRWRDRREHAIGIDPRLPNPQDTPRREPVEPLCCGINGVENLGRVRDLFYKA